MSFEVELNIFFSVMTLIALILILRIEVISRIENKRIDAVHDFNQYETSYYFRTYTFEERQSGKVLLKYIPFDKGVPSILTVSNLLNIFKWKESQFYPALETCIKESSYWNVKY